MEGEYSNNSRAEKMVEKGQEFYFKRRRWTLLIKVNIAKE